MLMKMEHIVSQGLALGASRAASLWIRSVLSGAQLMWFDSHGGAVSRSANGMLF